MAVGPHRSAHAPRLRPSFRSTMLMPASAQDLGDHRHHAGPVVVADHQHVPGDGHLDVVVVDHDDPGLGPQPEQGAGHRVVAAPQGDQVT